MALINPAFVIGQGTNTARMFRLTLQNIFGNSTGVLATSHLQVVAGATPATTVKVLAGSAVINGSYSTTQGAYLVTNDADLDPAVSGIPAASASNTRRDLIVARVYDADYNNPPDTTNVWAIERVAGTQTTGTPADPTPSFSSYIPLASVLVSSSGVQSITDKRTLASTAAQQTSGWLGPWSQSWGIVGITTMPSGTQTGVSSATDLTWGSTNLSVALTNSLIANRRYRVVAQIGEISGSAANSTAQLTIVGPNVGGITTWGRGLILLGGAGVSGTGRAETVFTAGGSYPSGTGTWKVQGLLASGSGTVSFGSTALTGSSSMLYIEDIGPATTTPF